MTPPSREEMSQAPMRSSFVYVIVLNWNGSNDTLNCVQSVLALGYESLHILVCDNASLPDEISKLKTGLQNIAPRNYQHEFFSPPSNRTPQLNIKRSPNGITLLHTGGNLGFAGGVNVGLRFALAQGDLDFAWVLNNDTEVDPGALAAVVDRMKTDPKIGICGSSLIYHGHRKQVQALGGASYQPWRARSRALGAFSRTCDIPTNPSIIEARMDYVVGAAMLVSRRFLETVGLMDESYFLYSEEHDWAHRGQHLGFFLAWAPKSIVYHKHGATIGTKASGGSQLSLYYLYRNKSLFTARHYKYLLPLALIYLATEGIKFLLKIEPGKARAVFSGLAAFVSGKTGPSYRR